MSIPTEVTTSPSGVISATNDVEFSLAGFVYGESLEGRLVVPVPNTSARDALVASFGPTAQKPLLVYRHDAPAHYRYELTTNGSTWETLGRPPVTTSGALLSGTYSGQPIRTKYINGNLTTDSNGDVIILANADFSGGGILTAHLAGASTFDLTFSYRMVSGNLVARMTEGGTVRTSTTAAVTGKVEFFRAS